MLFDELGRPVRRTASVVRHIELQRTASLPAGVIERDQFTVLAGRSWLGRRSRVSVSPPPGAASGNHTIAIHIMGSFANQAPLVATVAFNGHADAETDLSSTAIGSGRILDLYYHNGTNVAQTNPRNWHVTVIEEVS
jgi:hypothetical protein